MRATLTAAVDWEPHLLLPHSSIQFDWETQICFPVGGYDSTLPTANHGTQPRGSHEHLRANFFFYFKKNRFISHE
jgi:hypothetical protein